MTDSMQKMLDDIRKLETRAREADAAYSTRIFKSLADRIEAMMNEPVAIVIGKPGDNGGYVHWNPSGTMFKPENKLSIAPPDQTKRIEELERELAEVKKDAKRYQWLRVSVMSLSCADDDTDMGNFGFDCDQGPLVLDKAIDAALSQQEGKKND